MQLVAKSSRKEVVVTIAIWIVLVVISCCALFWLSQNAIRIIDRIHYVNVTRGDKASVLYAEADKNARIVLERAAELNQDSKRKISIKPNDQNLLKSLKLFQDAIKTDARPEFSSERTYYYELLGQVYDAAGNHPEQLLAHARAFISQNDNKDALDYIKDARKAAPESAEPLILLAQLQQKSGQSSVAMQTINDAIASYTVTPKARWVKGQLLLQSGQNSLAVSELQKAVDDDPENLTFRRDLANAQATLEQYLEATKTLEKGLNYGGWYDAGYLHTYGIFLVKNDDIDEAIRVLIQADKLAPYSGDIQWTLAEAYHKAGKARQEAAVLRRAIEVKPELRNKIF